MKRILLAAVMLLSLLIVPAINVSAIEPPMDWSTVECADIDWDAVDWTTYDHDNFWDASVFNSVRKWLQDEAPFESIFAFARGADGYVAAATDVLGYRFMLEPEKCLIALAKEEVFQQDRIIDICAGASLYYSDNPFLFFDAIESVRLDPNTHPEAVALLEQLINEVENHFVIPPNTGDSIGLVVAAFACSGLGLVALRKKRG